MTTADEYKNKGNAALQGGNIDEAIKFYSDGIDLDPKNHVLYSNRSAAYCKNQDYTNALKDGNTCVELNKSWIKGHLRKIAALEFLERFEDAETAYEEALQIDPKNEQLLNGLESIRGKSMFGSLKESVMTNPKFKAYRDDPEFMNKLSMIAKNPQMLGILMQQDERIKDVLLGFSGMDEEKMDTQPPPVAKTTKSESCEPTKPSLSENEQKALDEKSLGNSAYKKKDFETALKHYNEAIKLDPINITYYNNKSAVYFEMKDYDACIKQCEESVEIGRENRADYKSIAKAYSRIGLCYEKRDDLDNAKKFYDKSLSEFRAPDIIKKQQNIRKILEERQRQAYINPEKSEEEKAIGNKLFTEGKWPDALKHYTEAIKRNPEDAKIYSNRAACYTKLMEFPSALSDCNKCIELDPKFIKGYLRKGACLTAMKDFNEARKAYRKALEIDPACSEATEGLRQSYSSDTDPEAVRQRAMNDPEVAKILSDPAMRMILNQLQDPGALQEHMGNPEIASKIAKLMDAGLIQIR